MTICHQFLISTVSLNRSPMNLSSYVGVRVNRYSLCRSTHPRRRSRSLHSRGWVCYLFRIRALAAGGPVLGRIGTIVVKPSDHDFKWFRLYRGIRDLIPFGERWEVDTHAFGSERTNTAPERPEAIYFLIIQGDGHVRTISETPPDQLSQNASWTHFYKMRHTRGMHRLNHLTKTDRGGKLVCEESASSLGCLRIDVRSLVGVNL